MKEKELTAVEKLFNIWLNREYITEDEWLEAIEMEKEIAEKEFFKGLNFGINIPNDMTPSQYYNETFKQQEQ
jgi:hypothetical protein